MTLRAAALAAMLPVLAVAADWDKDKIVGSPSAPVAIEIYASFDCPHCKILHETMLPLMLKDMVSPGKAVIVFKEYPLSGPYHKYSREAANLATAGARMGKYAVVSDALFKTQATWAENGKIMEAITPLLGGVDLNKLKALANDAGVAGEVERDLQEGTSSGIGQTPTLMVIAQRSGKRYPFAGMPPSYELFRDFILKDVK